MQTKMASAHESEEMLTFEHWLRTGFVLDEADLALRMERKFNPYHDPQDGRFTFGPGGQAAARPGTGKGGTAKHHGHKAPISLAEAKARARRAMVIYNAELARGKSPEEAAAWAATADAESNSNPAQHQEPHGPGRGLFQWGDNHPNADRRITFQHVMKQSIDRSTIGQQLDFRDWELNNTHKSAKNAIDAARGVADKVRAITNYYTSPRDKVAAIRDRTAIANEILIRAKSL